MSPSELSALAPRRSWPELISFSRRRGHQIRRRRYVIRSASTATVVALCAAVVVLRGGPSGERLTTDKPTHPPAYVPAPADGDGLPLATAGGLQSGPANAPAATSRPNPTAAGGGPRVPAAAVGGAPSQGLGSGLVPDDRLAFTTNNDGDFAQIALVSGDGRGRTVVSHDLPFNDSAPAWSPDGQRIAFVSDRDNPERRAHILNEIYVMNADGAGERRLTHAIPGGNGNSSPSWSPDGSWIAFDGDDAQGHGDIWLIHPDGSGLTNLTNSPGVEDYSPSWAPDGRRIAFVSERTGSAHIWVMNADGSGARVLTADPAASQRPSWSPDGQHIAFDRVGADGFRHVWVMDADGSNQRLLVPGPGESSWPTWSPDGSQVVFAKDPDGFMDAYDELNYGSTHGGPQPGALAVIGVDGSGLRLLTTPGQATNDYAPAVRRR